MSTRIVAAVAALAIAPLGATAAPAFADTLLSGYGGPGSGAQAILGATLIGGPSGNSSGGGGPTAPTALSAPGAGASGAGGGSTRGSSSHRARHGAAANHAAASGPVAIAPFTAPYRRVSVNSPALGLSGADLLYLVLALAVLGVTAALMRRLSRPGAGHGG